MGVAGGGCRVARVDQGQPEVHGGVEVRSLFGRGTGLSSLSLRTLWFAPGESPGLANFGCDELLYPLAGRATVRVDGRPADVRAHEGLLLRAGQVLQVLNPGPRPFRVAASRAPDPCSPQGFAPRLPDAPRTSSGAAFRARWVDRALQRGDGVELRELFGPTNGSLEQALRVLLVPPGAGDLHTHGFEQVLLVLQGLGEVRCDAGRASLAPGDALQVPAGSPHVLRAFRSPLVLAAWVHPAGAPLVRHVA